MCTCMCTTAHNYQGVTRSTDNTPTQGQTRKMAAIVISKERLLHLALLVGCSVAFAMLLMYVMDWSRMAAFGLSVTTVCQINTVVVGERDKKAKAEEKALQRSERKETEGSTKKKH